MNGFFINYDLWFYTLFAFEEYHPDPDDLDWLSDWQSSENPSYTLTGLEAIQEDFAWYESEAKHSDAALKEVMELATILVMAKFVALVQSALSCSAVIGHIPVLATAHDFDIIGRFES